MLTASLLQSCALAPADTAPPGVVAAHLFARAERSAADGEFAVATALVEQAVTLAPPGDPYRPAYTARLAALRGLARTRRIELPSSAGTPNIDPRGQRLVFAAGGQIVVAGLAPTAERRSFPAPPGTVEVAFSSDGRYLFLETAGDEVVAMDVDGRVVGRWPSRAADHATSHVTIDATGKVAWDACLSSDVACTRRWTHRGAPDAQIRTQRHLVTDAGDLVTLEATPDTHRPTERWREVSLVLYRTDGGVDRVDLNPYVPVTAPITLFASANGRTALVDSPSGTWLVDFPSEPVHWGAPPPTAPPEPVLVAAPGHVSAMSSDGRTVITFDGESVVHADPRRHEPLARRPLRPDDVFKADPDAGSLVLRVDNEVHVVPVATEQPAEHWSLGPVAAADIEGELLVYASDQGQLRKRDLRSGREEALPAHLPRVDTIGIEPGGGRIALTMSQATSTAVWSGPPTGPPDGRSDVPGGLYKCQPVPSHNRVFCWLGGWVDVASGRRLDLTGSGGTLCGDGRHAVDEAGGVGYRLVDRSGGVVHTFGQGGRTLLGGVCAQSVQVYAEGPRFELADGATTVVFTPSGAHRVAPSGAVLPLPPLPEGRVWVSPDAQWALVYEPAARGAPLRLHATLTGTAVSFDVPREGAFLTAGFSPDSHSLYTLDDSGHLARWAIP